MTYRSKIDKLLKLGIDGKMKQIGRWKIRYSQGFILLSSSETDVIQVYSIGHKTKLETFRSYGKIWFWNTYTTEEFRKCFGSESLTQKKVEQLINQFYQTYHLLESSELYFIYETIQREAADVVSQ